MYDVDEMPVPYADKNFSITTIIQSISEFNNDYIIL